MKVQLNDIRAPETWGGKEPINHSPAFDYCRKLLKEGANPDEPLEVYRGEKLAYTVTTIELGATKKIREDKYRGPEEVKYKPFIPFKTPVAVTT
jgi:hypothetical protein